MKAPTDVLHGWTLSPAQPTTHQQQPTQTMAPYPQPSLAAIIRGKVWIKGEHARILIQSIHRHLDAFGITGRKGSDTEHFRPILTFKHPQHGALWICFSEAAHEAVFRASVAARDVLNDHKVMAQPKSHQLAVWSRPLASLGASAGGCPRLTSWSHCERLRQVIVFAEHHEHASL